MINLADASAFVTKLKGAAMSCLVLMWAMKETRSNWNRNELATLTGWSRENVSQGLQRLALHRLVARQNYETWQLTDMGYQFNFANLKCQPDSREPLRVDIFDSQRRSGGFKLIESINSKDTYKQPPLQQQNFLRVENFDSQENRPTGQLVFDWLTSLLIRKCGAPPQNAQSAINQALAGGAEPETIIQNVMGWLAYCQSQHGRGLRPAIFIPTRIGQGLPPPEWYSIPIGVELDIRRLQEELSELPEDKKRAGQ